MEEAAGGEKFGVEQGGTGGAADQVVRKKRQLNVEERAFADTADDRGHAVAGVDVAAWLRAAPLVEDHHGIPEGGRQRGQL